jgi:hypothetical protein
MIKSKDLIMMILDGVYMRQKYFYHNNKIMLYSKNMIPIKMDLLTI